MPKLREDSPIQWALWYANLGWPVLPLIERSKVPLTWNGLFDADTRPQIIKAWWSAKPNANIGLRTGVAFDVIDVDGDDGRTSLSEADPGWRHRGPASFTGKGEHYLIQATGSANRAGILKGVDFRGINGYIVAPPSIHPEGGTYRWDTDRNLHTPLPTTPDWLRPLLVPWIEKPTIIRENFDPATNVLAFAQERGWHLKYKSREYWTHCPLGTHSDSDPSFTINDNMNVWYCHGCNQGGGYYTLKRLLE